VYPPIFGLGLKMSSESDVGVEVSTSAFAGADG